MIAEATPSEKLSTLERRLLRCIDVDRRTSVAGVSFFFFDNEFKFTFHFTVDFCDTECFPLFL